MVSVSRRETRIILIGVVMTMSVLLARGIIAPAQRYYSASLSTLERERDLRRHEERLVGDRVKMATSTQALRDSLTSASVRVLEARAATAASMQLATRLREMALDEDVHGSRLTDLGGDSLTGSLRLVRVQIESQARFSQLVDFLAGIESDTLRMNVSDLEIVATGATVPAGAGGTDREGPAPVLRFRAVVTALARVEPQATRVRY
jgi:type II secretory pathway component PulM